MANTFYLDWILQTCIQVYPNTIFLLIVTFSNALDVDFPYLNEKFISGPGPFIPNTSQAFIIISLEMFRKDSLV